MIILLFFSFLAGLVTIFSPCILPVLPIVLSASGAKGKRRPIGIITGFILSFTIVSLFSFSLLKFLHISANDLRTIAIIILVVFGFSLLIPDLKSFLFNKVSKKKHRVHKDSDGLRGGTLIGLTIGLVWTPCIGPILASVLAIAATSGVSLNVLLIVFSFSVGAAIPMLLIALTERTLLEKIPWVTKNSANIQKGFGLLMILTALALYSNFDAKIQSWFSNGGEGIFTQIEDNPTVQKELEKLEER